MKFAVLVYETPASFDAREAPGERDAYWAGYTAYTATLSEAKAMTGGAALAPPGSATTVRVRGGARQVLDGPYADTKEQLGGFYLIEAADLDAALALAAQCPAARAGAGCVEVRPLHSM